MPPTKVSLGTSNNVNTTCTERCIQFLDMPSSNNVLSLSENDEHELKIKLVPPPENDVSLIIRIGRTKLNESYSINDHIKDQQEDIDEERKLASWFLVRDKDNNDEEIPASITGASFTFNYPAGFEMRTLRLRLLPDFNTYGDIFQWTIDEISSSSTSDDTEDMPYQENILHIQIRDAGERFDTLEEDSTLNILSVIDVPVLSDGARNKMLPLIEAEDQRAFLKLKFEAERLGAKGERIPFGFEIADDPENIVIEIEFSDNEGNIRIDLTR